MTTEQVLIEFYTYFKNRDYAGMATLYHPQVEFSDPVFPSLKGKEVSAMWHMLVSRGKETQISFGNIKTNEVSGYCQWQAIYSYGAKKRRVHNFVSSKFTFQDGKILKQSDSFDLWKWLRMALGITGALLGWSSLLKGKVRKLADRSLREFIESNPEYRS